MYEEEHLRNSMILHTACAICLGHSGNLQGGYRFLCLNSGRVITQYNWTQLPMPEAVIAWVKLVSADQPEQLIFSDRWGHELGEIELPGVYTDPFADADDNGDLQSKVFELNDLPTEVTMDLVLMQKQLRMTLSQKSQT